MKWSLAAAALLTVAATAQAQPVDARCSGEEWRALRAAVDRFCRDRRDPDCRDRDTLVGCNPDLGSTTIARRPGLVLAIRADCWQWIVRLRPPSGRAPSSWRRIPIARLFRERWRVVGIHIDVSRCD